MNFPDPIEDLTSLCAEWGILDTPPRVRRGSFVVDGLRSLSGLRWGDAAPTHLLLHGGGQNAHTFDAVALLFGAPVLALDLAGHGHSDTAPTSPTDIVQHARDVGHVLGYLEGRPLHVVGMSMGGLVALHLADQWPDLVARVTLLDITPAPGGERSRAMLERLNNRGSFAHLDEMMGHVADLSTTRTASSLRRGVRHNAVQRPDGRWIWRYDRPGQTFSAPDVTGLWDVVSSISAPLSLFYGELPGSMVSPHDRAELRTRRPDSLQRPFAHGGHSLQSDCPREVALALKELG